MIIFSQYFIIMIIFKQLSNEIVCDWIVSKWVPGSIQKLLLRQDADPNQDQIVACKIVAETDFCLVTRFAYQSLKEQQQMEEGEEESIDHCSTFLEDPFPIGVHQYQYQYQSISDQYYCCCQANLDAILSTCEGFQSYKPLPHFIIIKYWMNFNCIWIEIRFCKWF